MSTAQSKWFPLLASRAGVAGVFGALFWLCALTMIWRAGVWGGLSAAEQMLCVSFVALLYAAAVSSARRRPLGGRFSANGVALVALMVLLVMLAVSVLAPLVALHDPAALDAPSRSRYAAPAFDHPMGTDRFGRDVWARVVFGGRASFGVCALSVLLAGLVGVLLGAVSGVSPRRVDDTIMRVVDGMLSFPRLLLLLAVVAFLPPNPALLAVMIAATSWMGIARIVRGEVRRLRDREFVDAAVAAGMGRVRIVTRHVLPNALGPVIVAATLSAGTVILMESSLSFLGLGVQPPSPSWGSMVFEGRDALGSAWWVSAFPAAAITVAVVALNVVGDGLRDALDARSASRR
jgi:peptide/nickel transport system permease protein